MKYNIIPLLIILMVLLFSCTDNPESLEQISITIENQTVVISSGSQQIKQSGNIEVVPMEELGDIIDYNDMTVFTEKAIWVDNLVYIPVLCNGLYDEYVYNVDAESGLYMSGVLSLCKEYDDLMELVQRNEYPYFLNDLVSVNDGLSAAIIRKSKKEDYIIGKYLSGEYYIFDFETGTSEYICDSYPNYSNKIPGTRIEYIEWYGDNEAKISVYNNDGDNYVYEVIKEENSWRVAYDAQIDADVAGEFNTTRELGNVCRSEAMEHFIDPKTDIYNKMLNTIDYLDRVTATAKTNMLGASETTLTYDVNIDSGISYQSVKENDVLVSENFSDTKSGVVSVNNVRKTYTDSYLPTYTRNDTQYIALDKRIVDGDDGIPCYSYRRNITNCSLASYCLVPQEITFSYLKDFDTWEIDDRDAEYLGRPCIVISGTPSPYIATKHKIDSFKMTVDKETGVLLGFEGNLGDKLVRYMNVTEISYTDEGEAVKTFDTAAYSNYKSLARE